ncbi:MAG: hypothetical protein ABI345_00120 [Jatrophihabitans sp.]
MGAFSGSEPLVGEIVGLRTFRVDDYGMLLPLYSNGAWYDGPNTAECDPPTGDYPLIPHPAPSPECECGFYIYGTTEAADQNRHVRRVKAVVSVWGRVVAGTQGVRAEHARIDALWLHPDAPQWARHRIEVRYPSAQVYTEADAMLAEHPLTQLPCYEPTPTRRRVPGLLIVCALLAIMTLGVLPYETLLATPALGAAWLAATVLAAAVTVHFAVTARWPGHLSAAGMVAQLVIWLLTPLLGALGLGLGLLAWAVRALLLWNPLLHLAGVLVGLRPGHFPIVVTPREKTFRGVRL